MRTFIRRWLGIDEDILILHKHLTDLHDEMIGLRSDLAVTFYDEHDLRRKAMSDKLGQRAIKRLNAEDHARKLITGEL